MKKRNSVYDSLYPAYYRHDLMVWRRVQMGISIQETARRAGERFGTVRKVFMGQATSKKAYPVAKVLNLDWIQVHNLDLKESDFHLAILNGDGNTHSLGEEEAGTLAAEPAS